MPLVDANLLVYAPVRSLPEHNWWSQAERRDKPAAYGPIAGLIGDDEDQRGPRGIEVRG